MLPTRLLNTFEITDNCTRAMIGSLRGQYRGEALSGRTVQPEMKNAVAKVSLEKKVTVHTQHHWVTTHLLESGTDIRYRCGGIIKTMMIYMHITAYAEE